MLFYAAFLRTQFLEVCGGLIWIGVSILSNKKGISNWDITWRFTLIGWVYQTQICYK